MENALGLGQIGILVRFLRDFYAIFFVNLTYAPEKIGKKNHQKRFFGMFWDRKKGECSWFGSKPCFYSLNSSVFTWFVSKSTKLYYFWSKTEERRHKKFPWYIWTSKWILIWFLAYFPEFFCLNGRVFGKNQPKEYYICWKQYFLAAFFCYISQSGTAHITVHTTLLRILLRVNQITQNFPINIAPILATALVQNI